MRIVLALMVLGSSGCHAVLGDYTVGEEPLVLSGCSGDDDCDASANEGCDDGRCAIRCLDNTPCPPFSECWAAEFCTEPIGTPCDPASTTACGGYLCRDRDASAMPVAGYCPGYCNPTVEPCPTGYTCLQLSCYVD